MTMKENGVCNFMEEFGNVELGQAMKKMGGKSIEAKLDGVNSVFSNSALSILDPDDVIDNKD